MMLGCNFLAKRKMIEVDSGRPTTSSATVAIERDRRNQNRGGRVWGNGAKLTEAHLLEALLGLWWRRVKHVVDGLVHPEAHNAAEPLVQLRGLHLEQAAAACIGSVHPNNQPARSSEQ